MQQQRSRAQSKAIPSSMSAKPRDNPLHIYSIFFEEMWWSLNETAVCSQRAEWSRWLSTWAAWWILNGLCVQAYWWLWAAWLWKILQQHWFKRQCLFFFIFSLLDWGTSWVLHPTPQTSMQTKTNPTSEQSPADSWQYKMTTTKHQSIHQLFIEIKTKRTNQQKGSCCFVCFRQSQVKW